MKIGILSMQRIKNSGSFLQGFALKKEIESLGHDVVWVDYYIDEKNTDFSFGYNIKKRMKSFLKKTISRKYRKQCYVFNKIHTYHENFDKFYFRDLGMESYKKYKPKIDMLVIGSDEVFNLVQFEEYYHTNIPWELYGDGFDDIKVISYAASCGTTTIDNMKFYGLYDKSVECLSKFTSISVRDKNTKQYIESMGLPCQINIDPVLVYDFSVYECPKVNIKDYIVVYAYNLRFNNEEKKAIRKFADSKGKKLICINEQQDFCDENLVVHPLEMLSYFKYADYVITDTFHGAVISMKYHKIFGAFIRESNKQKLGYLIEQFGMSSRIINSTEDLDKIMDIPIDYSQFDEILAIEREKSRCYLKESLGVKE